MRVKLTQAGGQLAALPMTVEVDSSALAPADAAELGRLVEAADPFALPEPAATPANARDLRAYELAVEDGDRRRAIRFTDVTTPPALQPLIGWLRQRGSAAMRG